MNSNERMIEIIKRANIVVEKAKKKDVSEEDIKEILQSDEDYYMAVGLIASLMLSFDYRGNFTNFKESKINLICNRTNSDKKIKLFLNDFRKQTYPRPWKIKSSRKYIYDSVKLYTPKTLIKDFDNEKMVLMGVWLDNTFLHYNKEQEDDDIEE